MGRVWPPSLVRNQFLTLWKMNSSLIKTGAKWAASVLRYHSRGRVLTACSEVTFSLPRKFLFPGDDTNDVWLNKFWDPQFFLLYAYVRIFTKIKTMSPLNFYLWIWEVLKFPISINSEVSLYPRDFRLAALRCTSASIPGLDFFFNVGINWQQLEIKRFPNWICDLCEKSRRFGNQPMVPQRTMGWVGKGPPPLSYVLRPHSHHFSQLRICLAPVWIWVSGPASFILDLLTS